MNEAQNTKLVQDAYAAFGRGDIQAILDRLDDTVVWQAIYGAGSHVPQAGPRRGKAGVAQFFRELAASTEFSRFEPREFIAQGDRVVVLGEYGAKSRKTGKPIDAKWVMVFTVKNGKVTDFIEFTDVAQINAAYVAGVAV
jgi:ketosteroid isomerase-like protein